VTPDQLRQRRPAELRDALGELGITDPQIHRLGLADGHLHTQNDEFRSLLNTFVDDASLVIAPFEHDGHPDHDVLGSVMLDLCDDRVTLWRFPIWTWAWTQPGDQDWIPQVRRLPGSSGGRHRKARAIEKFSTQIKPLSDHPADQAVVDDVLLRHALLAPEAVLI